MCKDKDKYQQNKEFQGNFIKKTSKFVKIQEKIRIIKKIFETLRARRIVKTQGVCEGTNPHPRQVCPIIPKMKLQE